MTDDLTPAIAALTDHERAALEHRAIDVARHFADTGTPRVAAVFHALGILAAEDGDRRGELTEHARRTVDGDDTGAQVLDLDALLAAGREELRRPTGDTDPPTAA